MNKARSFEDFILDDYNYNLLEDWDLEYLWEWVEFDDFSDLEEEFYNSQSFDPDSDNEDDDEDVDDTVENDFLKSIGLLGNNDTDKAIKEEEDNDDEYSFDFNFDDDSNQNNTDDTDNTLTHSHNNTSSYHKDTVSENDDDDDFLKSIGMYDEDDDDDDEDDDDDHESNEDNNAEDSEEDDFLKSIGMYDENDEEEGDDEEDAYDSDAELLGGPRYIQTSQGTIDIELDDILAELQKIEFDEFIDILKKNNHVYHKILTQQEWSGEELEFLQSIEPLIRPEPTPQKKEPEKSNKNSKSKDMGNNKLIDTQVYQTVKEMYAGLNEKALILARQNQRKVQYTPKNMPKMWTIDTEKKREHRIKLIFGGDIRILKRTDTQKQLISNLQTQAPRNDLSNVIYGKNEIRYAELLEIISNELEAMIENLDAQALEFITQDGKRFSFQFIEFLVQKYGSKIYYLYQSQLKSDVSADKLSDALDDILNDYFDFPDPEKFLTDFFRGIIITLENKGLLF